MVKDGEIHLSLDEARDELAKRWENVELKRAIEVELGEHLLADFNDKPRAVLTRQLCSPDNGLDFFIRRAKYINASPFGWEFHGDTFVHFNEEKKGLSRLRVLLGVGVKATIDIFDFHKAERKALGEIALNTGEKLVDFHHALLNLSQFKIETRDNTLWFKQLGHASDYYYCLLLHFVAHGVLFTNFEFFEDDGSESVFMRDVVNPAIEKIEKKFGMKPMFVRMYSQNQDDDEDFYWWSYPKAENDYIVDYAQKNKLKIKNIKI